MDWPEGGSMTARNIGGPIDWATLYGRDQHRPTDQAGITAAVRELAAQGFKPHDISVTLRIGLAAVMQALSAPAEAQP